METDGVLVIQSCWYC